ncbi:MAG: response regulator [Rhodospirillales bacterium]|nr:response regulator [Rhodospirillales bacterium]
MLVVDDDEITVQMLEFILAEMGFMNIQSFLNGRDALAWLNVDSSQPSLIICDWMMPETSGMEVLHRVRVGESKVPFIMLTSKNDQADVEAAVGQGVSAYLSKPVTVEGLKAKVKYCLS